MHGARREQTDQLYYLNHGRCIYRGPGMVQTAKDPEKQKLLYKNNMRKYMGKNNVIGNMPINYSIVCSTVNKIFCDQIYCPA